MRYFISFILIVITIFIANAFTSVKTYAQIVTNPTLYCLGSCPTPQLPQTTKPVQQGIAPAVEPSTTENTPVPLPTGGTNTTPVPSATIVPCETDTVSVQHKKKKHKKKNRGAIGNIMQEFIKFIIELLNSLLRIIGGGREIPLPPTDPCNLPISPEPFLSPQPEASPSSSLTPSVTGIIPTAPPPAAVAPGNFPGPTNTGYKNAPGYPGTLTPFTGTVESNKTYKFVDIPNGIAIPTGVTNVTFYGCHFASNEIVNATVTTHGDNITFDYCSFTPKTSLASAPPVAYNKGYQFAINQAGQGKITIDHSDFWGWGNAIQFQYSTKDKPFVVRNSWFHDAREDGGIDHTDAILESWGGPSYMVFDHNTIVSNGNTNGLALQGPSYTNVTVTNNYFSGFGMTVALGTKAASTNLIFTDNVFGTDIQPYYRPLYGWFANGTGNVWRRNKIHYVPGSQVYLDREHQTGLITATDEGKYWLPNDTISATDYTGQ